ncbi:MAG: SDR family oxidoreductase, partial [Pseudomonadales bacterium]|nr:SDR family oxidoreductase [Pseudomonadales bacterium]
TLRLAEADAPQGVRVSAHRCDVADEGDIERLCAEVQQAHASDCVHLLFNNAGIAGGGSFVAATREEWERTFDICWRGVYLMCRHFLPLLVRAPEGHVVNTSSVNGFRAALGANIPHTAYSAAKYAVRGFTEGLINDFRFNAPHLRASVVMPGYVGSGIARNTLEILGRDVMGDLSDAFIDAHRDSYVAEGWLTDRDAPADEIRAHLATITDRYEDGGITPAAAAGIILAGVRDERWRILVGEDAALLDAAVRGDPEGTYDLDFFDRAMAES